MSLTKPDIYKHTKNNLLFRCWYGMMRRCYHPGSRDYKYYGRRGIGVIQRWHDFHNFVDDMGHSFRNGLTIERIDNDKGYSPANCKWATVIEQCNNRQTCNYITNPHTGEIKTITEWARFYNISRNTITSRIRLGYSDFDLLVSRKLPRWNEVQLKHPETGKSQAISAWERELGINPGTASKRWVEGKRDFNVIFYQGDLRSSNKD